jgi:hypothetical protein
MSDDLDFSAQVPKRDPGVEYIPPPPAPPPPRVPYRLYRPGVVETFLFLTAAAGVLMLAVATYLHGPLLFLAVTGDRAEGTVVRRDQRLAGFIVRRGRAIRVNDTGFCVAYNPGDGEREKWVWARGEYPGWEVGTAFPVVYPPGDPDAAAPASFAFHFETDRALWFSLCLTGFGLAAGVGGLVGGVRMRGRRLQAKAALADVAG